MDTKNKLTIFHIHRKDGSSLFLHPFSDSDLLMKLDDSFEIVGLYGNEPRVESLTMFRNDLYRLIESAVKRWISDIKFIPSFILSAAVFLFIYLTASFIIRDPIPLIDELALSFGGSIAVFFILAKKDQNSEKSAKKRLTLRLAIDKIVFEALASCTNCRIRSRIAEPLQNTSQHPCSPQEHRGPGKIFQTHGYTG